MPSALDLRLDAAYKLITGPGGPIEVRTIEQDGRTLPYISNAPTNLTDYIAFFSAQHGDATFLVEGNERLSFARTWAAARKVAAGLIEGYGVGRDRKSGVEGKSGSVGVDLGGRRTIKKKKKQ